MGGIPPVEPHKLAVRGIPISDLPEAAGKGFKTTERQSADCRGLWGSTGRFQSRCRSRDTDYGLKVQRV